MFSDAYGEQREHYVDLFADEEARLGHYKEKKSCFLTIEEVVERLREQPCINERIATVEEFDEPFGPLSVLNVLAKPCYFVVVQTASYWWSLERRDDIIVIQRSKNFSSVHSRCKGTYRNYRWLLETAPTSQRSLRCRRGPKLAELFSSMLRDGVFDARGSESSSWEFSNYVFDFCLNDSQPLRAQAEPN